MIGSIVLAVFMVIVCIIIFNVSSSSIEIDPQKRAEIEEANKITEGIQAIQRQLKTADSEQRALLMAQWRRLLDRFNTIVEGWKKELFTNGNFNKRKR